MLARKWFLVLIVAFAAVLVGGILIATFEGRANSGDKLHRVTGDVKLVLDPASVKLEPEHQIHFKARILNSSSEPIQAWALDLGKQLYLVEARPAELIYHKGHAQGKHGNVLIYATPIAPGDTSEIALVVRVLFDSTGSFNPMPELRLSYAGSAWDMQSLSVQGLQEFRDTFITFPFSTATIQIER